MVVPSALGCLLKVIPLMCRNPLAAFNEAGFSDVNFRSFDVPGMGPIAPHVSGVAKV